MYLFVNLRASLFNKGETCGSNFILRDWGNRLPTCQDDSDKTELLNMTMNQSNFFFI